MKAYYGATISVHMTKTPEGFLICQDVPICRTGTQEYLASEIGGAGNELVSVDRPAAEVFKPAAISSFEGKPVTDDHPPVEVDAANFANYTKGTVKNVRRGEGENDNKLICDLVIYDANLIAKIENGKREISCGYDCKFIEGSKGSYYQSDIIGNHVAVVDNGRAGHEVAIQDTKNKKIKGVNKMAKSSIFQRMFAAFSKDAEPDEVREAARAVDEAENNLGGEKPAAETTPTKDEDMELVMKAIHELSEKVSALESKNKESEPPTSLDTLEETLANGGTSNDEETPQVATQSPESLEDEDTTEEGESEQTIAADDEDVETSEEGETAQARDKAVALSIVRAMKPVIAAMPTAQRKKASDALSKAVKDAIKINTKTQPLNGGYGALMKRKTTDAAAKRQADLRAFGENCRKRNPHYMNTKGDK